MSDRFEAVLSGYDGSLDERARSLIAAHTARDVPRLERLWAYFRNPLEPIGRGGIDGGVRYRAAQEAGLPDRVTGRGLDPLDPDRGRREVVVENDIGWRVAAMVDFMFGSPVRIESLAADPAKRDEIEDVLERVWERSGGIALMQDLATLGHVYGHVDLLVRVDEAALFGATLATADDAVSIEPIEARRGVAMVSEDDYRELDAYAVLHDRGGAGSGHPAPRRRGLIERIVGSGGARGDDAGATARGVVGEVITRDGWRRFEGDTVVAQGRRAVLSGAVPVVHIQNMSQPFVYTGLGEVEALIPLQDELNTRLSDRANRVTLQSFKMYLARGIEGFDGAGVGPGTVWSTDNPEASITSFGGDASSPSEDRHIGEIREAMDKISGVPPLAGGVVKARLGNLSSANALRVTLMGLIAKTKRKRITYGRGIERASAMVLGALNDAGVLATRHDERGVRVRWGALGPIGETEVLEQARGEVELGADRASVVAGLGLDDPDPGVV